VCYAQNSHATQSSLHTLFSLYAFLPLQQRASTTIYSQVCELQGSPMISYFSGHSGALSPHVLHDLSSLESTPVMLPRFAPMMLSLHPRSTPWSHNLGRPWLPLNHVLHAHMAAPSASSCCVSCWVTRMPWTILRPSFRSCQVEPMTCTSRCALPNSHLRAGCKFLRCRIPRQPLFSSAYTPDEFSCLAWTFQRPAHVRQQYALPIFLLEPTAI
jgi:hypothetical protein